jgi:uncharacterized membrane protein YczE
MKGETMKFIYRILTYLIGIVILSFGSILTIKSNLGASSIALMSLSVSRATPLTLGTAAFFLFCIYVGIQIILLKREFKPIQILQIAFALVFGQLLNFFNQFLQFPDQSFWLMGILMVIGISLTSVGIFLTIIPKLVPLAPDGLTQALSYKFGWEFGKAKIITDIILVSTGFLIQLLFAGAQFQGIGIGTLLSAYFTGRLITILNKKFKKQLDFFLHVSNKVVN